MTIRQATLVLTATVCALLLQACSKVAETQPAGSAPAAAAGLAKVKVGYIGLTCEAPIFSAIEKGFFTEEGIEPELVKCEWSKYKDVLALGGYDITHHLVMYFLKPIEQGLDVKMTGGVHTGCLRVQTAANGPIKKLEDLRGKKIGVPGMGTPPHIFANRALGMIGVDPAKDIDWRVFPAGELGLALEKGEVDALGTAEPIGTMLQATGKVMTLADQAKDAPWKDEYCCAVVANGKWLAANEDLAARATRAILKGAKWVQTNPRAAAVLAVEKKYLASNPELNTSALGNLNYLPSVVGGEEAIKKAAADMKKAGMLSPTTDIETLAQKAWKPLPGVSEQWVEGLKVEKVAGGQIGPDQPARLLAELEAIHRPFKIATCCSPATMAPPPLD